MERLKRETSFVRENFSAHQLLGPCRLTVLRSASKITRGPDSRSGRKAGESRFSWNSEGVEERHQREKNEAWCWFDEAAPQSWIN